MKKQFRHGRAVVKTSGSRYSLRGCQVWHILEDCREGLREAAFEPHCLACLQVFVLNWLIQSRLAPGDNGEDSSSLREYVCGYQQPQ